MTFRIFDRRFVSVLVLGILAIFSVSVAIADGGGSHGGGTGVACFKTVEDAQKVKAANGQISPEILPHLRSVTVTDQFEFDKKYGPFFDIYPGDSNVNVDVTDLKNPAVLNQVRAMFETPRQYLDRIIDEKMASLSPAFAALLKEALDQVAVAKWQNQPLRLINDLDLPSALDLRTRLTESPKCALVPIVNRESTPQPGLWPQGKITFNPLLFDHLLYENISYDNDQVYPILRHGGFVGAAFLLLHEALYLIADKMGQDTSLLSRELAALLLSPNTYNFVKHEMAFMRLLYYAGFDRLELFFDAEEKHQMNTTKNVRPLRDDAVKYPRYQFYRSIMQNILRIENQWLDEQCQQMTGETCQNLQPNYLRIENKDVQERVCHFFNSAEVAERTDLEAFMLIAWNVFTVINPQRWDEATQRIAGLTKSKSMLGQRPDFFSLLSPSRDEVFTVKFICQSIRDFFVIEKMQKKNDPRLEYYTLKLGAPLLVIGTPPLWGKAQRYCHSLGVK